MGRPPRAATNDDDLIGAAVAERLAPAVGPLDDDVPSDGLRAEADVHSRIIASQVAVGRPHITSNGP